MTKEALQENIDSHLNAIDLCMENHHRMPALILIYSGIDIFSSLTRPIDRENVTRQDFINWAEKYLLNKSPIGCNAIDLYAARCSIVHTYTSGSSLSRKKQAKEILYSWGNRKPESLQNVIDKTKIDNVTVIHIDALSEAFKKAVQELAADMQHDKDLESRVLNRTNKMFKNQSWKL